MSSKTDIWMPLYIGDYLADTAHLDAERSGCYLHWLMHYWRKGPLPDDIEALITIGKLRSPKPSSIAQALLTEYFTKNGDGLWHHNRVDAEKNHWNARRLRAQEKASRAAKVSWEKRASRDAASNAQGMPAQCPSSSPSPLSERQKTRTLARNVLPEELAGTLPLVDGTDYLVSKDQVQEWSQAFPAVDVKQELRKFKVWLDANPTRRKTSKGVARAIYGWLSRAQDKPQGGLNGSRAQERTNGNAAAARRALESLDYDGSLSAG